MKRLTRREFTAAGIIAALGVAATAGGCGFEPKRNEVEAVYGPPPEYTASEAFDPEENEPVDVYGPPPDDEPQDEGGD